MIYFFHVPNSNLWYGSDFQGTAGAFGDVYFGRFCLSGLSSNEYVLHTGGYVSLRNGSYLGDIDIGGDTLIRNAYIDGDIYTGRNIDNSRDFSITGNINAAGYINISHAGVFGQINSGFPYDPIVDHDALLNYFSNTSSSIGAMLDTGYITSQHGKLTIKAESGVNVFSINASQLKNAWGVYITGPSDAIVYINVMGNTAVLDSTNWHYNGGLTRHDVLVNYPSASNLNISGANKANLLAPFAHTDFYSGLVTGSLVVGNLMGKGQVNYGYFEHGPEFSSSSVPIPEPATIILFCLGCLCLVIIRWSQK